MPNKTLKIAISYLPFENDRKEIKALWIGSEGCFCFYYLKMHTALLFIKIKSDYHHYHIICSKAVGYNNTIPLTKIMYESQAQV